MPQEKRKFSRIPLKFSLTLTVEDGAVYPIDHFDDISIGGCLIPSQAEYAHHKRCTIKIALGEGPERGPQIAAHGTIIRHNEQQLAIKFTHIDPESLFHLQNLIRYNAPDPDKIDSEIQLHPGIL